MNGKRNMRLHSLLFLLIVFVLLSLVHQLAAEILIPMDLSQTDHLKAYGVAFYALIQQLNVKWLLNYRDGSFLIEDSKEIMSVCNIRGVSYQTVGTADLASIYSTMNESNMEVINLEQEPKIAVYTPPNSLPWDDAVTLALTYAEIKYDKIWDEEVLSGALKDYDWLHLHHEDFTGQYGKFYGSYRTSDWYQEDVRVNEAMAKRNGFNKVWQLKHTIAEHIREYVVNGGFLFAMCAATETLDIALSAAGIDIVEEQIDGDPLDPNYQSKLDFSRTFAFENYTLTPNPYKYEFSSIDTSEKRKLSNADQDFFALFDFSAKFDPVPTMLTQCHTSIVNGFMGQTTAFYKEFVKPAVIILGEAPGEDVVKYLHGNLGKGTFTFYGGHDPEDYAHRIGDPETNLSLHKNSPGYRLILNNILFPAAEKKKLKT
ncbi:MAG: asparagine synthetase B [Candidatus Cloacimonas sp.]